MLTVCCLLFIYTCIVYTCSLITNRRIATTAKSINAKARGNPAAVIADGPADKRDCVSCVCDK